MELELSPRAAEIVACAQSLLVAGGYNGFSYADISAAVQISKPTIHHHFPSKAELVQTVVKRYRQQARDGMAATDRAIADPVGRLEAYTAYWEACIRDGTASLCVCAMLAAEMPAIPPLVADEVRGHFFDLTGWLTTTLEQGVASGAFRLRASPRADAMALMATVHGAMLAARAYGDPAIFRTIVAPSMAQLSGKA
ncbi:TetR/AcrR family transcriptional regulator [Xylophilus sp. GOD-11R]|uniref:TetR/AcrR family transcriptional regulator n=1 Tax=Xylophilus sp. GOD-11R TaxID=3089814 RepID=UPI00298C4431|nr:TetR/AcrR family transcriptional regulator [Xylophilus sp. GOD-11R]WPB58267.1 TetR/AcrR family transcriptional regulator [Xylophilus sp. GOD-11R]